MKLTEIEIFKNTPFTDFQNTIHFGSNAERDNFFDTHYDRYTFGANFDFVKDRLVLRATIPTPQTYGMNYLRFKNDYEGGRWYYCFIMSTEYINEGVTEVGLVLDTVMTFTQGNFNNHLNNVNVTRQSLNAQDYDTYKYMLNTNQDTLVLPKQYTYQAIESWTELGIIFQSSVDLTKDFGTEKDPKLKTAKGGRYDSIVSPVDLYYCDNIDDFTTLMSGLSDFPWVSQNINNSAIVPRKMVDENDVNDLPHTPNDSVNQAHLKYFKKGGKTQTQVLSNLSYQLPDLPDKFKFPQNAPAWLMREQYANLEMTAWNGQSVSYDPTFLPSDGITVYGQSVFGYHNEIRCFIDRYKDNGENSIDGLFRGTYINQGLVFDNFDDIPMLIDNYKNYKASTAHQRELSNQRTISGRINAITNPNSSLDDRFFNAVSLTTGLMGGVAKNAMGQFTNEYEHYRDQRAELADKAITAPSVAAQNNSQSFNIAKQIYGVTLRFSSIGSLYSRVLAYHNTFGFDMGGQVMPVKSITSMPKMNYVAFSGNWTLPDVPSQFVQQLKVTFENGVKLWHNNNTNNPFNQNLMDNMA